MRKYYEVGIYPASGGLVCKQISNLCKDNELWDDKEELLYAMREGVAPAELVELGTRKSGTIGY